MTDTTPLGAKGLITPETIKTIQLDGPITIEETYAMIGYDYLHEDMHWRIIGVDNRPPKGRDGIYLTIKVPGRKCEHIRVGEAQ